MPSLREEVTKSFRRLGRRDRTNDPARAETVVASDPRLGKDYKTYRILKHLGFGGMGQVYLALDTSLGRHAALKFLDHRLTSDPGMLQRLQQEARTASSLNHPNILTIYEIGEAHGEHFIASEYVDGITLRAALDRRLITAKSAIEIVTQVASALVQAHAAGIIHRDLKSSNIMIRPDGLVKVIDFGLAKVSEEQTPSDAPHSGAGVIAGTVEYMSPEQARGDALDHRTDLWSLGVVLYESLAGKFPFDGPTESHAIVALLDHPVPPIENPTSLPNGVTEVIDQALTKDRGKRYQSAAEMLQDLQTLGISKQRISAIKRFTVLLDAKKSRTLPAVLASVGLLCVAAAVWWWAFDGRELVLGPDWFVPGPPQQITFDGKVELASISPDGKMLAYTTRDGAKETVRVRNLATKEESRLAPSDDKCLGLTFSPDGKSLYFVLRDARDWGRLFAVGVGSTIPSLALEDVDGPIAFSPDGKEFAFRRRSEDKRTTVEKVVVVRASDTGDQREIVKKANTEIGLRVAWSPSGNRIAAVMFSPVLQNTVRPNLEVFATDGTQVATFAQKEMWRLENPLWIGHRSLLAVTGVTQGRMSDQARLYQIALATHQIHETSEVYIVPASLSGTSDGKVLAAVRTSKTSSLWTADFRSLDAPSRLRSQSDLGTANSFTWLNDSEMVVSSLRSSAVNLSRLHVSSGQASAFGPTKDCVEHEPVSLPNSAEVIYSSNCGAGGREFNLWKLNTVTGAREQLTSGPSFDHEPTASPDGKWIAYTSWPSAIPSAWKIPAKGGTPKQISAIQALHPSISPDGQSVACIIRESYDGKLRLAVLSIVDGAIQHEFPDAPIKFPIRWSKDGHFLDVIGSGGTDIWRQPVSGGPAQLLIKGDGKPILDFSWNLAGTKLGILKGISEKDVILFRQAALP